MNTPADARAIAEQYLLGDLIKAATKHMKTLAVPWIQMKQSEQEATLLQVRDDLEKATRKAVEIIASGARVTFRAQCESVQFKPASEVKAVLSMYALEDGHELADVAGGTILVVIEDASRYLDAGNATQGDPDQKPLFDKTKQAQTTPMQKRKTKR